MALYINMRHSLQGFRNFFLTEVAASSKESGLAELRRLEQSHYLLVHRTDHEAAARFMRTKEGFGRTGLTGLAAVSNTALLEKLIQTNTPEVFDAILIMAIPQRWFKKSQRKGDILSHIDSMLPVTKNGQRLPNNYIWGYFTRWNEDQEKYIEPGVFHRNPNYHAHDGMYERWKQTQPKTPDQKALPLERSPKIPGPYSTRHGHPTFHGFRELPDT